MPGVSLGDKLDALTAAADRVLDAEADMERAKAAYEKARDAHAMASAAAQDLKHALKAAIDLLIGDPRTRQ